MGVSSTAPTLTCLERGVSHEELSERRVRCSGGEWQGLGEVILCSIQGRSNFGSNPESKGPSSDPEAMR